MSDMTLTADNGISELSQKSILFEIINRKNPGLPIEAFILNIPPSSIEIEEPQRVTHTKTFGGLFVDDYGEDNVKINISGDTGGSTVRKTYAFDTSEPFNGKAAFYYFRNKIMRYKEKRDDYADYDMVYYDLSSISNSESRNLKISTEQVEAYVVSLVKFKMSRSKERPLFYSYSIELVALRKIGTSDGRGTDPIEKPPIKDIVLNIRKSLNAIHSAFAKINSIKSEIESYMSFFEEVSTASLSFINKSSDIITYPSGLARIAMGKIKDIITHIDEIPDILVASGMKSYADIYGMIDLLRENAVASCALIVYAKTPSSSGSVRYVSPVDSSRMNRIVERFKDITYEDSGLISTPLAYQSEAPDYTNLLLLQIIPV